MIENICQFVPFYKDNYYYSIHTINYVLETKSQEYSLLLNQSVYKMHYVLEGNGFLHTADNKLPLKKGDIFFTFPNFTFSIESSNDLKYMYISFLGTRGNMLLEKLSISKKNYLFSGFDYLEDLWKNSISVSTEFSNIMSESVLLHTFARLGESLFPTDNNNSTKTETLSLHIKKYIDDNFSNPKFSLEHIAKGLSYNKKYISFVFKKETHTSLVEYLNTVRIQNAVTLMNQGFTSVSDIARSSGFSDPQYFSKVFKKHMSTTPANYIKQQAKK